MSTKLVGQGGGEDNPVSVNITQYGYLGTVPVRW